MKTNSFEFRILLASLLPLTLVSLLLAGIFVLVTFDDSDQYNSRRGRSLLHQLASASEYALFSSNAAQLQSFAQGAMHESDVRSVVIVNAYGQVLASAGKPSFQKLPALSAQPFEKVDRANSLKFISQSVTARQLVGQDIYESKVLESSAAPQLLGYVLMELSQDAMLQHQRRILLLGLGVTLACLLLGAVLALRLSRRVTYPIARLSRSIELIGQNQLSLRLPLLVDDPLREVHEGLNQMVAHLESNRDELELRVAEATLVSRQKMEEAELATRAKSRFLAAASHDLRQPTHALGMFVARLVQSPQPPENQQLIKSLESSVQAMQDLLDGLLDVSRFDAGAMQVRRRAFALSDIFVQLQTELSVVASEKGLRFRVRPTGVGVLSDPALLHRILLNLLSNAMRYTHRGGVLLACRPCADGKHVRVEVWDSGIGIAPEHHEAIFGEFYQVGNPERDRGNGLGLGLNIVERAAKLLEHRLQLKSRPGVGTRFGIEVPLAPGDAMMERRGAQRDRAADNLAGLRVMLVEDDALAREAVGSLLRSWGCVVAEASGLSAALAHWDDGVKPDVIVSDYRMPYGENGIDVIARLRARAGCAVPACLVSGDTDPGLMQEAKEAGLSLLHKPVRPAKLRSLLRRLVPDRQAEGSALP